MTSSRDELERELHNRELARRGYLNFLTYTYPTFNVGWFHRDLADIMDAFVEAVERKLAPRLMLWLPPGHGKSEMVSRRLPAFAFGKHPEWEWVTATYNQDFASDFGRDVRRIFEDPSYATLFPNTVPRKDSNSVDHFELTKAGKYTAVGVGGALTGKRANVLCIDDPCKGRAEADSDIERKRLNEWYMSVARTRLYPGGGIIICQTRWHEADLSGMLLEVAGLEPKADQWMNYSFPAIANEDEKYRKKGEALHPERYNLHELEKIRANYSASENIREWYALYQQNPRPTEGALFKREWFDFAVPPKGSNLNRYVTTDFAIGEKTTNDRTVLWPFDVDDQGDIWFGVPGRDRINAFTIVESLCDLMGGKDHRAIYVALENVHISKTIGPYLRKRMQERLIFTPMWSYTASKDKTARSASLRGRMQQRKVHFHPSTRDIVEDEFIPFPAAKYDDGVDAASIGALMLDDIVTPAGPPPPPKDPAPAWSYEWMKERMDKQDGKARAHVPKHLNGKERKSKAPEHAWST